MRAQDQIHEALNTIMEPGDANACQVYKGTDYDGVWQGYGWWYRPFNRTPVYLGKSLAEALGTIEQIEDSREPAEREESLSALAEMTGIPYNTLAKYAREGRFPARKSGGVWLATRGAVEAAGIRARHQAPADEGGGEE